MVIARDRYLDDSSRFLLTLALSSRTLEMHGVLTSLAADERERIAAELGRALDDIEAILRARLHRVDQAGE